MTSPDSSRAGNERADAFLDFVREFYLEDKDRADEASARAFFFALQGRMAADMWPAGWTANEIARRLMDARSSTWLAGPHTRK
jgi:hypothetical protein